MTDFNLGHVVGPQGVQGPAGKGITSIAKTGTSGLVDTYTITYSDNTPSTFTVTTGSDASATPLADSITDGDTTHAVTGNAVYDGLALKANTSHNHNLADVSDTDTVECTITYTDDSTETVELVVYTGT